MSQKVHIFKKNRGGIMGIELCPILSTDFHNSEPLYAIFEMSSASQWTPSHFCVSPNPLQAQILTPIDSNMNVLPATTSIALFLYDLSDAKLSLSHMRLPLLCLTLILKQTVHLIPILDNSETQAVDCFLTFLPFEEFAGKHPTNFHLLVIKKPQKTSDFFFFKLLTHTCMK
jgi:hypothetical protein